MSTKYTKRVRGNGSRVARRVFGTQIFSNFLSLSASVPLFADLRQGGPGCPEERTPISC